MFSNKTFSCSVAARGASIVLGLCMLPGLSLLSGCSALGLTYSLTGLTIEPGSGDTVIVPGVVAQFRAIGTYTEGGHATQTKDLTDQVTWSTTIPDVATVNAEGQATGVGVGITSVLATISGAHGQLTAISNITVNAPAGGGGTTTRTLTSVTMIPPSQSLTAIGQTAQFIVVGSYSAAPTSADLTSSATWESSDTSVATVASGAGNSPGLVTAVGPGTATITALATGPDGSVLGATGTVIVTVSATSSGAHSLTAVNIDPGAQTLSVAGETSQLIAIGTYTTSPVASNITSTATWQSSDTSVAMVNSTGLVTAMGAGTATITAFGTASDGSVIFGTASITVLSSAPQARTLTGLAVIPASQTTGQVGETAQFLAIGSYSSAPLTADLTSQVTWISSDTTVATVSNSGLATTVGTGSATITALATAQDGSVLAATGTVSWPVGTSSSGTPGLYSLTLYGAGSGSGTVTSSPGAISCSYTGPATANGSGTPSAQCTGTFAVGTVVTLTAAPGSGAVFDGWSSNCAPVLGTPTECTITINSNTSVGAIFDPQ